MSYAIKFFMIIISTILIVNASVLSHAETKKKSKTEQKSTTKTSQLIENDDIDKYNETILDLSSVTLPKKYKGQDITKINNILFKRHTLAKDEYETSDQFNRRKTDEMSKPLIGNLKIDSTFAFLIKSNIQYNADNKSISLYINNSGIKSETEIKNDEIGVLVKTQSSNNKTYTKTTPIGMKYKVKSENSSSIYLSINNKYNQFFWKIKNDDNSQNEYIDSNIFFTLDDISPDVAKELKDELRLLFITKLESPYISRGVTTKLPYTNSPTEFNREYSNINAVLNEVWIYNYKSGVIYKKIPLFHNSEPITIDAENPTRTMFLAKYVKFHSSKNRKDIDEMSFILSPEYIQQSLYDDKIETRDDLYKRTKDSKASSTLKDSVSVLSVKSTENEAIVKRKFVSEGLTTMMNMKSVKYIEYDDKYTDTWVKSGNKWLLIKAVWDEHLYKVEGNIFISKKRAE